MRRGLKALPRSHDGLIREGFTYAFPGKCRASECGAALVWYRTAGGKLVPIDAKSRKVHFITCAARKVKRSDPEPDTQLDLFAHGW